MLWELNANLPPVGRVRLVIYVVYIRREGYFDLILKLVELLIYRPQCEDERFQCRLDILEYLRVMPLEMVVFVQKLEGWLREEEEGCLRYLLRRNVLELREL